MSDMKCPFCQQKLVREGSDNYWCKKCNLERHTPALYGSQKLWQELIRTRKALEQSEICCTEWEKQALDYKAENIALSGDLERTRKALDVAKDTIIHADWFFDGDYNVDTKTMHNEIKCAIKGITALEQKDK